MILRKTLRVPHSLSEGPSTVAQQHRWGSRTSSLRWRLSMLSAAMVAVAVILMTLVAFLTVFTSLSSTVDRDLDERATSLLENTMDPLYVMRLNEEVKQFRIYNPDTRISISPPGWAVSIGDPIYTRSTAKGEEKDGVTTTIETVGRERILTKTNAYNARVTLAREMTSPQQVLSSLAVVLISISAMGVVVSIGVGMIIANTGLKPLARLQRAVEYVTRTDKLKPIEVSGHDELAHLTRSFNDMMEALQRSRVRQTQLVADAGHELKTPLTSMRTNIELLMMVNRADSTATIPPEDRAALEKDVLAQMEELSTLVGDLVDLAREDAPQQMVEDADLADIMDTSLERVRRRRPDVTFDAQVESWIVQGDSFALGRAMLNLLDNAAKWSPAEGTVRIRMTRVDEHTLGITIADEGPGIPPEDRERVFERFYRSAESRSMPGSGLGLAIVRQVIERHGGSIVTDEAPSGGAMMRVTLPGRANYDDESDVRPPQDSGEEAGKEHRKAFAERWFKRRSE
ncbi:HAMP domain-containing protein [Corynebacterium sp. 3HC-13]|uniref:HAMP domain-containing sensor histidine kinase n=1 Tax=Corynebacterium poyangense TaxID=2684405 RepID=UPI001CCAE4A1|nr:HAMP domain-containing sensor histidine kinase [Corynebacterium poyangense]MBZ8176293.1 HAMP domain-containing protein [Corynebacterium poyangense]